MLALGAPEGRGGRSSRSPKTFHPGWTSVSPVNPLTPCPPLLGCCGMRDVRSLKKMRAENETGRGESKCVRVHSTTMLTIEHIPLLDCTEMQIWCQISNIIT